MQHDLQPFSADHPDWGDIEKVPGQYEKFVKDLKIDRAGRAGTTAFFLLCNGALFLTYALIAVQHTGESPLDRIPLQDETPPREVATALPLAFIVIHILLGVILAAKVA